VQRPEIWKLIGVSAIIAFKDWREPMMHRMSGVDTARGKDNDQQNLSKMIMWYRSIYS